MERIFKLSVYGIFGFLFFIPVCILGYKGDYKECWNDYIQNIDIIKMQTERSNK